MSKEHYKNYVTNHFSNAHKKDYEQQFRYYDVNYTDIIPKNKDTRILDLGCGIGHFLYYTKKKGYKHVIGVDFSKECVDKTKQLNLGFEIKESDIMDFLKNNFQKFEVIVMNDIIEHLEKENILLVLRLINKALSEDGIIIVKTPNASNMITGSSSRYIDFTHTTCFTNESMSQVLKMTGFNDVKVYGQQMMMFNPLINLILGIFYGLQYIILRLLFLINGRKTTKIFSKTLIATGKK
jgi:2-polyprenyl-3-methyl-5-hydroxy-6-metoxy-1,4-benzoquinol methylase